MALIKSQLVLTDGMTGPLKSINKAMNIVLNSFEAMQDASGRAIDTASIQEAREELARASAALDQLEDHTNKSTDAFSRLAKAIGLVMIACKALDTIKTGIDYASDLAEVQNVVDVTFGSATEAIQLSLLGVAGYIKVGNSLTEPMCSDDSLENYWFTPIYCSDVWTIRRLFKGRTLL